MTEYQKAFSRFLTRHQGTFVDETDVMVMAFLEKCEQRNLTMEEAFCLYQELPQ